MTAPTIRQLLADVLDESSANESDWPCSYDMADALLASPELAAIIGYAEWWDGFGPGQRPKPELSPEVQALRADWRENR